jgi:hypothetical protein
LAHFILLWVLIAGLQFHGDAAADQNPAARLQNLDFIAANVAFV